MARVSQIVGRTPCGKNVVGLHKRLFAMPISFQSAGGAGRNAAGYRLPQSSGLESNGRLGVPLFVANRQHTKLKFMN